jgi:hypothetical protein
MATNCPTDEFVTFCIGDGVANASGSVCLHLSHLHSWWPGAWLIGLPRGQDCSIGRACDRGDLVPADLQYFSASHSCDGYIDCGSLEDELWQIDAATGARGESCAAPLLGLAAVATVAGIVALLLATSIVVWLLRVQRQTVFPLGNAFVGPLVAGYCLGSSATVLLGVSVSNMGVSDALLTQVPATAPPDCRQHAHLRTRPACRGRLTGPAA